MPHKAKALILHCIDFRFQQPIQKFLADKGLLGLADIVSLAGSAKNFVNPAMPSDREFLMRQVDISVKLHEIEKILIVNHQDCGAYGGSKSFANFEHEEREYKEDMKALKQAILEKYPNVAVEMYIALMEGDVVEV